MVLWIIRICFNVYFVQCMCQTRKCQFVIESIYIAFCRLTKRIGVWSTFWSFSFMISGRRPSFTSPTSSSSFFFRWIGRSHILVPSIVVGRVFSMSWRQKFFLHFHYFNMDALFVELPTRILYQPDLRTSHSFRRNIWTHSH